MTLHPGDVVIADFLGDQGYKRRPVVVISTDVYHATRPDVVLAELTSQNVVNPSPTDYFLQDWAAAGLFKPSWFRVYLNTIRADLVIDWIGRLTDRDWQEAQARLRIGLAVS